MPPGKRLILAGLAVAAVLLAAAPSLRSWQVNAGDGAQPVAAKPSPTSPELEAALQAMRNGLTNLRQAAKTGDPAALQEAERDILAPLLDALALICVDGRVDAGRYMRVYETVLEVQGLFKEIPYFLEVQPGGGLPSFRLLLRRSPYPAIQARRLGWRVETQGDGVILRP